MHTYYSKFVDDPNVNFTPNDLKALNTLIREEEEHVCWAESRDKLTEKEMKSYERAFRRLNILNRIRNNIEFIRNNPGTGIFFAE